MNIHVVTPFSRFHLETVLLDHLRPFNIQWHPITNGAQSLVTQEPWVHSFVYDTPEVFDICYEKLNGWLSTYPLIDDDYYCFMCDDDGYTLNFFDQLRECTHSVVFVTTRGEGFQMCACPSNSRVGGSGLRSYAVKGTIAKTMRFNEGNHAADGQMTQHLYATVADHVFRPDMIVDYNMFEIKG
jgi:hypothetical protein